MEPDGEYIFLNDESTFSEAAGCRLVRHYPDGSVRSWDLMKLLYKCSASNLHTNILAAYDAAEDHPPATTIEVELES